MWPRHDKLLWITGLLAGIKIVAMAFWPPSGDFIIWTTGAQTVLSDFLVGKLPSLTTTGVYGPIFVILAPFYWLWSALPLPHPALQALAPFSLSTVSLGLVMKTPLFLGDIITAVLVSRLVTAISHSSARSRIAFLSWYANPFASYWTYAYGGVEVIPISILLLGLAFGNDDKWFRCGLCIFISGALRLFGFAVFPFLIPMVKSRASRIALFSGFVIPFALSLLTLYVKSAGSFGEIASIPVTDTRHTPLLYFLGPNIPVGPFVVLMPMLLVIQFYITLRCWKKNPNIVHVATVALLALLVGSLPSVGTGYHFLWVSPLLSICLGLSSSERWLFALTFLAAFFAPLMYPFSAWIPAHEILNAILIAFFYGMEATYLASINMSNVSGNVKEWLLKYHYDSDAEVAKTAKPVRLRSGFP